MRRMATVIACTVAVVIGCGAAPQSDTSTTENAEAATATDDQHQIEFLFVHSAESATLADGVLRLGDVSPATIYFSDRPDRVAGHLTTEEFVGTWGEGEDSFASNPPNATLSILEGDEPQEIVVVLTEPRLEDGDLIYNVQILDGASAATGGGSSLFIDIIGRPLTPMSMAGVARRTTRRAIVF